MMKIIAVFLSGLMKLKNWDTFKTIEMVAAKEGRND
jgi:hypothetical protein